jgi:predicted Rdx family selenoprotein
VGLATELEQNGHDAAALEGRRSQFDVVVDGNVVFSKEREHRFPEPDEILAKL